MTVKQLARLLKRAKHAGLSDAIVTFDAVTKPLLVTTRFAITDAEVHHLGTSLSKPSDTLIEIRLVGKAVEGDA